MAQQATAPLLTAMATRAMAQQDMCRRRGCHLCNIQRHRDSVRCWCQAVLVQPLQYSRYSTAVAVQLLLEAHAVQEMYTAPYALRTLYWISC
jgi:hypothetical protein